MKQVRSAVLSMDGHLSRGEFLTLCQAVYEVREQLPEVPQMKSVYADVKRNLGWGTAVSISKSIERAVRHLFERGDLSLLELYQRSWRFERPAPSEFIRVVALRLWLGDAPVRR